MKRFYPICGNHFIHVLKLFAGFARAAFTALKLTVINAMPNVMAAAKTKIHQCSGVR